MKVPKSFSVDDTTLNTFLDICQENKIDHNQIVNDFIKKIVTDKQFLNEIVKKSKEQSLV